MSAHEQQVQDALALHQAGRLDEAEARYDSILASHPQEALVLQLKGLVRHQRGDSATAIGLLRRAIALDDSQPVWHRNLGICLQATGDLAGARDACQRAVTLDDKDPESLLALARVKILLGDTAPAYELLLRATSLAPRRVDVLKAAGYCAGNLGRYAEARQHYEAARQLAPEDPAVFSALGAVYHAQAEFPRAVDAFGRAVALAPRDASGWLKLAVVEFDAGNFDASARHLANAVALVPDLAGARLLAGRLAEARGDVAAAAAAYAEVLARRPDDTNAAFALSRIDVRRLPAPTVAALGVLLGRDATPAPDRARAGFVLAALAEKEGDLAREVALLRQANRLHRARGHYDVARDVAVLRRIRELFTPALYGQWRDQSPSQAAPVFILGMPRSGTTLCEQVLASHSRVRAMGEQPYVALAIRDAFADAGKPWPELLAAVDAGRLARLAASWERQVGLRPGEVITDKSIDDWRYAGLLALAFPRARFIDVRRHPVDTGIGCFRQMFQWGQFYTSDLGEFVQVYREWHAMLAHWHRLFGERIHVLQYEQLVADPGGQIRALVAGAGLGWEEACLEFHRAAHGVNTASSVQVRQGLFTSAAGRWRRYDGLFPELEGLAGLA